MIIKGQIIHQLKKISREIFETLPDKNKLIEDNGRLVITYPGGKRFISLGSMIFYAEFKIDLAVVIEYEAIERFVYRYPDIFELVGPTQSYTHILAQNNVKDSIDIKYLDHGRLKFACTTQGLNDLRTYGREVLCDLILPLAEKMRDVRYLDSHFNSKRYFGPKNVSYRPHGRKQADQIKRVVISKLAGSDNWKWLLEDLEANVVKYRAMIGTKEGRGLEKYNELPPIIEEFKEYIQELQPLKNPDLFSEENIIT